MSGAPEKRVGVLIQARMSSRRVPGKVLRELAGKPLLAYVDERCRAVTNADRVAVITSREKSDDPIEAFAADHDIDIFRGPLDDVAQRFLDASQAFSLDGFVRINADSPLIDPRLIERAIELYRASEVDLATNVIRRTFPAGMSVEAVGVRRFAEAVPEFDAEEREHVTLYYYRHPEIFRIASFEAERDLGDRSLTVDTPEDVERMERLIGAMDRAPAEYDCDAIVALAERIDALGMKEDAVR